MFQELKDLIFGIRKYNKTRIETRIREISNLIPNLKIENISQFEILENSISKLLEELRVKSSNLNKIILNPKRNLLKKDILNLISNLNEIKYNFLKKTFENNIQEDKKKSISRNKEMILIIENDIYNVFIQNTKPQFIQINFLKKIEFGIIKIILSLLYNNLDFKNYNIQIRNNQICIIKREYNDNLFIFKRKEKSDLKKILDILKEKLKEKEQNDYIPIENKKEEVFKKQKPNLDDILLNSKDVGVFHREDNNKLDNKIEIEPSKKIEIEFSENNEDMTYTDKLDNNNISIYKDETITVILSKSAKVFGTIEMNLNNKLIFKKVKREDFTYLLIFTKIFASILFQTLECDGTNINYNLKNNKLFIVPRYKDDKGIYVLKSKTISPEILKNILNSLHLNLNKNLTNLNVKTKEIPSEKKGNLNQKEIVQIDKGNDETKKIRAEYIIKYLKKI